MSNPLKNLLAVIPNAIVQPQVKQAVWEAATTCPASCDLDPGADLTGGHTCSGRRGPWEAGPWRPPGLGGPRKAKFWLAIAKS